MLGNLGLPYFVFKYTSTSQNYAGKSQEHQASDTSQTHPLPAQQGARFEAQHDLEQWRNSECLTSEGLKENSLVCWSGYADGMPTLTSLLCEMASILVFDVAAKRLIWFDGHSPPLLTDSYSRGPKSPWVVQVVLVEAQARGKSAWRLMGPAAQLRVERDTGRKITGAVAQFFLEAEHRDVSGQHH
ncbi:hypothetical protein CI102_5105 [Trichoderma harzianum]|nr:hypothetical protein CI102_5105 [Trichoderma harzianum]